MLEPGTQIAGYRIERTIGRGGMGVVYEATQLSLGRAVALKIVAPDLAADAGFRERFRREGTIQAGLDHPSIVTVYEAGETSDGLLFLAMRLVRGPSLRELIARRGLADERALHLLAQVADGLDAAHEAELVHRDVKPANILVDERDRAFLADFGLTRAVAQRGMTKTGHLVGTLDYLAPEQITGQAITGAADVYALGIVLYECLVGSVPFRRDSEAAVMYAHLSEPCPPVTRSRPDLPAELDAIVARALAKSPADRHGTASELIAEARRALAVRQAQPLATAPTRFATQDTASWLDRIPGTMADTHEQATLAASPSSPPPARRRPSRPLLAAAAAALVAGVVAAVVATTTGGDGPRGADGLLEAAPAAAPAPAPAPPAPAPTPAAAPAPATAESPPAVAPRDPPLPLPSATPATVSVGPVSLDVPADWAATGTGSTAPRLGAETPLALRAPTGGILLGSVYRAERSDLLPAGIDAALVRSGAVEIVLVAGVEALRYRGIRPRGSSLELTLYALPTLPRSTLLSCAAPPDDAFHDACGRAVASARLEPGTRVSEVRPSPAFGRIVDGVVAGLNGERRRGRAALAAAPNAPGQAAAATALARAFEDARERLRGRVADLDGLRPFERAATTALLAGLRAAERAYRQIAVAAGRVDPEAYRAAAAAVGRAERELQAAIRSLRALGYRVT